MHRIEGDGFIDIGGKNSFSNGPPGTVVTDDIMNAKQEEVASTIEEAGLTLLTAGTDTRDQLKDAVKRLANLYAFISYEPASGVHGGGSVVGSWNTLRLNRFVSNITGASFDDGNDQFTLPIGTYKISIHCPAFAGAGNKAKLYNVTDASDEIIGTSTSNAGAAGVVPQVHSYILGIVTLASAKVFEIRHRVNGSNPFEGFGVINVYGINEVHVKATVIKIQE